MSLFAPGLCCFTVLPCFARPNWRLGQLQETGHRHRRQLSLDRCKSSSGTMSHWPAYWTFSLGDTVAKLWPMRWLAKNLLLKLVCIVCGLHWRSLEHIGAIVVAYWFALLQSGCWQGDPQTNASFPSGLVRMWLWPCDPWWISALPGSPYRWVLLNMHCRLYFEFRWTSSTITATTNYHQGR